jgi:hypothetical protein
MRQGLSLLSWTAAVVLAGLPVLGQGTSTATSQGAGAWFLNGHVLMEDGTVPTQTVDIESICSGVHHTEAHIDKKGEFSFRLGKANNPVTMDASELSTSMAANPLGDCVIRAILVGYRSDVILLEGRTQADSRNIGTIILHSTGNAPAGPVSAASLAAPKNAQKAYAKGVEAEKDRKNLEASKNLAEAVHLYPQYAEAWYELGKVQASMNDAAASRQSFDMAISADANFTPPYLKIALLDEQAKDWKGLADTTAKLIKIAPDSDAQVYLYNSAANYNLKDMAASEASARAGLKADTMHRIPKFWYILGVLLGNRGDLAGAIDQYKNYLQYAPDGPDAATVSKQLAELQKVAGAAAKE